MTKSKRQILAQIDLKMGFLILLLMSCLIVPIVTTYVYFQVQKKQVKKEIKRKMIAGIDRDELILLKFTAADMQRSLKWEHAKEFEYKDQMYDIVVKEIKGDTTFFWCWLDHEETILNKELRRLVSLVLGGDTKRHENQNHLEDFFKKLYCHSSEKECIAIINSTKNCFLFFNQVVKSDSTPPTPPPQLV